MKTLDLVHSKFVVQDIDKDLFEQVMTLEKYCDHVTSKESEGVYMFAFERGLFEDFVCDIEDVGVSYFEYFEECQNCCGEGVISIGPTCALPAWKCCGGCYTDHECQSCEGTGFFKQ